ncbi:uncharacterized protein ACA1_259120 [Acanthamoeba castellanii str. Neff]|uniref:Uncharacterized protein n=1 Tax=Acanthamoeba castellanii (strain ATCC 30010 / Neff) TaxID=1257118 RepID=L8GFL0_ACACF|nr:uncharacterized protein ACA1_259120 [Acanthamoeba castellanii str. Neff]ELR11619.1 hypothetical protein ACA1_259120 [Acanthamoeba castellanii str. Neff]
MRNRDLPLPAIRIFAEGVLQLLRQSPSSSSPPSDTPSSAGSGAEAAKWLCGQLDVEGFVGDEANQRLANDVWIDLATHSVTLRRLKGVLKAILRSYELIEAFYRTAEFPVECAGCGGRICLSCVNLCQACHHAHAPLKQQSKVVLRRRLVHVMRVALVVELAATRRFWLLVRPRPLGTKRKNGDECSFGAGLD